MKNKYEDIEILALDDSEDVYNIIELELDALESEYDYIACYAKRDLINELFVYMVSDGYEIGYADFDMLDSCLTGEVYLMIIRADGTISVEPAYSKGGQIIKHDAKTAIVYMDDCDQDIVDYCVNSDKNVILFDFSDDEFFDDDIEYEYDCANCYLDDCIHCDRLESKDKDFESNDKNAYTISIKCNLDTDEAERIIADMEKRVEHMNNMFAEMDMFRRMFRW